MSDPDKREDELTPELDAETVEDLEPVDDDEVAGGFRSGGCMT